MIRNGHWNMTLYDYSQTTTITRKPTIVDGQKIFDGQPLDVKVNIDKIGNMDMHVSNVFNGAELLGLLSNVKPSIVCIDI